MSEYKKPIDLTTCSPHLIAVHYGDPDYKPCVKSQKRLCDDLWFRYQNHERLKKFVVSLVDFVEINVGDTNLTRQAEEFLAALEAEKGGEL